MLDDKELYEIEQRATKATKGPWFCADMRRDLGELHIKDIDSELFIVYCSDDKPEQDTWDGDFVAHAREDVPKLIAEIKRLRRLFNQ